MQIPAKSLNQLSSQTSNSILKIYENKVTNNESDSILHIKRINDDDFNYDEESIRLI